MKGILTKRVCLVMMVKAILIISAVIYFSGCHGAFEGYNWHLRMHKCENSIQVFYREADVPFKFRIVSIITTDETDSPREALEDLTELACEKNAKAILFGPTSIHDDEISTAYIIKAR